MLPLEGIHVLELDTRGPASFSAGMLGDLGAEVIRVELPAGAALAGRRALTSYQHDHARETANRNKQSITVAIDSERGMEVMEALVGWADVLLEEFLPGAMGEAGLGSERLHAINPRLVHCAITAYGHDGPYRNLPGDELTAQALGGYLQMRGNSLGNVANPVRGHSALPGAMVAEHKAASHAVIAVLAALRHRRMSGVGQFIDVSLLDGVVAQEAVRPMGGGDRREGERRPSGGIYETKDGRYLALAAGEPWAWTNLITTLDRPDYSDIRAINDDYNKGREVYDFVVSAFKTKTRDEWLAVFEDVDTEVAPVYLAEEVSGDPQMRLRDQQIEITTVDGRTLMQYGIPIHLSDTPGAVRGPAPRPGQDTDEVLRALGQS